MCYIYTHTHTHTQTTFKKSSNKQGKDSWRSKTKIKKSNRNYNVDFADQEFIIGFCQIALDLFRTSYNTHTI